MNTTDFVSLALQAILVIVTLNCILRKVLRNDR